MKTKSARGNGSGQIELELHVACFLKKKLKMAFESLKNSS
jgi:hypothetical protein